MKKIVIVLLFPVFIACTQKPSTDTEAVISEYYAGFKNSDYSQIKATLSDSLTITEGDYVMKFTPESYYVHFKWDSIFKPFYTLVDIENNNAQVTATASVSSLRFAFLKNNPLTCKHRFYFASGKITKIENIDCPGADWQVWQKQVDSLVSWISEQHPELDGFIYDQTLKGGQNYLKAIELYNNR